MKTDKWIEMLKGWKIKKDKLLILLLLGILLLVIAIPAGKGKKKEYTDREPEDAGTGAASGASMTEQEYVSYMERHLENILSQMKGVGDVTVMITLKESAEKIVEKDVENSSESVNEEDSQGGMRETMNSTRGETTVYRGEGSSGGFGGGEGSASGQDPYVSKELTPRAEGVVVVAQGGDDAVVIQNITESVQALFGIDTHKIRIVKKE